MSKILYIGDSAQGTTSLHRADALRRLGHHVVIADPYEANAKSYQHRLLAAFHFRTGYRFLAPIAERYLRQSALKTSVDLVWVNSGELLDRSTILFLKAHYGAPVVLYNNDDPTGGRDGRRFNLLLRAIETYDVCVVPRESTARDLREIGVKRVLVSMMAYDEVAHRPFACDADIPARFRSEVAFIGSWMRGEGRDEFLLSLLEEGVPVSIWGRHWERSRFWAKLRPIWRGPNLVGRDYVAAIQGAKVCLGLLSSGNRDLYTSRTFEVPFANGVLCAQRTAIHSELFREGEEATFWASAHECALRCRALLADDDYRRSVRDAGRAAVLRSGSGNEDRLRVILDQI